MNFEWSASVVAKNTITITPTTITLNSAASRHFQNVQYVLLGVDRSENKLGIKPIDKSTLDKNIYPHEQLHKISLGKSYGRISNKLFIDDLDKEYNLDLQSGNGLKFDASYDVVHQILLVDLLRRG